MSEKHKILVVDDEIGIVSYLYDFFTRKGFEVLQATSAGKAIKIAKKEKPSVVLLDIKMGRGKSGLDVLKGIKEAFPWMKVIMMTGVGEQKVIDEAYRLGADDYFKKPFSLKYLENTVILKILNLEIDRIGKGGSD